MKQEFCQTVENVGNRNNFKQSCTIQGKFSTIGENFEHYVNSPKQLQAPPLFQVQLPPTQLCSPDILSNQTCTEVDLVASSLQTPPIYCDMSLPSSSKHPPFYPPINTVNIEDCTENNIRAQPDGEEPKLSKQELPRIEICSEIFAEDFSKTPETSSNTPKNSDDLDEMMNQISSDLDYLLNGDSELALLPEKQHKVSDSSRNISTEFSDKPICKTNSMRRLSKPHIHIEKIDEEDEEEPETDVVIKGILRTKC